MRFSAKWGQYYLLTISRTSRETYDPILRKIEKGRFFDKFWPFFPNFGKTGFFSQNPALSLFIPYNHLTKPAISRKSYERLLRSRCARTNGRTTHYFFSIQLNSRELRIDRAPGQLWTHICRERRKQSRRGFRHSKENSELHIEDFRFIFRFRALF